MSFTKLFFDNIDWDKGPHFICPNCKKDFFDDVKFGEVRSAIKGKIKDFNQKVSFTCPFCGIFIELFVALHLYEDRTLGVCFQKSGEEGAGGIPSNWWVRPT